MKTLTRITALLLVLMFVASLCGCGGGNIVGSWKTRPQVDENGEVIIIDDKDIMLFTFLSDGTGEQSLPEYGEQVVVSYTWKTKGKTLTLKSGEEVYKFRYSVKGHVLKLTREGSDVTYEFIKV